MSTNRRTPALVWGTWRVEQVNLDGRVRLCVKHSGYVVADCRTAQEALDVLTRNGVPVDQLTYEGSPDR